MLGTTPAYDMLSYPDFTSRFRGVWRQGEHVALLGPTGSGKTYTLRDIANIRRWVVVLAVKRKDDTLDLFTRGTAPFERIGKWPANYNQNRVVLSLPPSSLRDVTQADKIYDVLNDVFLAGGWCLVLDDTAYIAAHLGLRRQIAQLLNVGRSSGISLMTAATQASSVAANIPSEYLRQVRHVLMWRFEDARDREACARITGLPKATIEDAMAQLTVYPDSSTDFLYYRRGHGLSIIRQTRYGGMAA